MVKIRIEGDTSISMKVINLFVLSGMGGSGEVGQETNGMCTRTPQ